MSLLGVVLAHGAVGPLDELGLLLGPAAVLVLLLRTRSPVDQPAESREPPGGVDEERA